MGSAMRGMLDSFNQIFRRVTTNTIYFYSLLVGLVTGGLTLVFYKSLLVLTRFNFETLANVPILLPGSDLVREGVLGPDPRRWVFFLLPVAGGLLTGLVIRYWSREAAGTGTEIFLDTFHNRGGVMRRRSAFVKFLASLCTLATGGSAGKEGPMAQIGAGIGSLFGRFLKMGARAQRTMLLVGAAGGLGAIFRAPLGGALTAVEILYKEDLESDALIPCVISSVTAYTVFCSVMGFRHVFDIRVSAFHSPAELLFYALLGVLCSVAGYFFVRVFHGMKSHVFDRLAWPQPYLAMFGGFLVGCIGFFFPEVYWEGFGVIQQAIHGYYDMNWVSACRIFAVLALVKILATSFTIQSGGSGGIFAPSLFIGGMLGGLVGTLGHHFYPQLVPEVAPFIVVGMASFFAGVANASIAALVIVCELTGGYELLPPLMVVSVISLIFSRRWSIYVNQVHNKFSSMAHAWDMNPARFQQTSVADAFRGSYHTRATVRESDTLGQVQALAKQYYETDFVVRDAQNRLVGFISLRDLENVPEGEVGRAPSTQVASVMRKGLFFARPDSLLQEVIRLLAESDFDKVPILDGEEKLAGYIQHKDILRAIRVRTP